MNEEKPTKSARPVLEAIRAELRSEASMGPSRLELEKRRLLASVDAGRPVTADTGHFGWAPRVAIAAAVLLAVIGAVTWRLIDRPELPSSIHLTGLWRLAGNDALASGQRARVPENQGAKIVWPDKTALWLASQAEVSLEGPDAVRFERGRLLASVAPREAARAFRIDTPLGRIIVHGTAFSVTGDGDRIAVRLYEGSVTFERSGETIPLTPGLELSLQKGDAPGVHPIDETGMLADLLITERTAHLEGPPVPELGRRFEMSALDIVVDRAPPEPADGVTPPRKRRVRNRSAAPGDAGDAKTSKPDGLFLDPEIEAIEVEAAEAPGDSDPAPRIEAMIRKGRYKDGIRAAEAYLEAHPKGRHVERVQFLKGYCQTRSGDLKAGREAFEHYLIEFPEGRYWKSVHDILGE